MRRGRTVYVAVCEDCGAKRSDPAFGGLTKANLSHDGCGGLVRIVARIVAPAIAKHLSREAKAHQAKAHRLRAMAGVA